ncbi:MAG: hypothetical protein PHS92_00020 [Candidatus Gracilibacteria bacterium]|nr:hypothetical protein [Candidatus Gracilibacteria bacterium]
MVIIVKIIYMLCLAASGILVIKYRKIVYEWTGRIVWAEKFLGSGGTIIFIILMGLLLIFLSVTYPFGVFDDLLKKDGSGISTIENSYNSDSSETDSSAQVGN